MHVPPVTSGTVTQGLLADWNPLSEHGPWITERKDCQSSYSEGNGGERERERERERETVDLMIVLPSFVATG